MSQYMLLDFKITLHVMPFILCQFTWEVCELNSLAPTRRMSSKNKADAEKFQHQLLELLKDEANRVCADCRARGPRWASWNLGQSVCHSALGYLNRKSIQISLR